MREIAYSIVDVFAEQALAGNALAIFHDGRNLTTAEMQSLARETNLSETTFIIPSEVPQSEAANGVRVRIFTAQEELQFAGHPTLGTASWLYLHHPVLKGVAEITLLLNVGPIAVTFDPTSTAQQGVMATMRQNDPIFGKQHDRAEVARAIGMTEDDLLEGFSPQTVSTGMAFCIVPLKSVAVANRLQMSQKTAQAWLDTTDAKFFYCIAPVEDGKAQWHARMQFYNGEDPATGSASGCCISWLVSVGLVESETPTLIEQGIEMLRPSRITTQATLISAHNSSTGLRVGSVRVSGRTIPVARGIFELPATDQLFTGL